MFNAIGRIFRTPDLRRKLGFTLGIVALFRLGSFIPAPFVDFGNVQACLAASQGASGLYELVNLFTGGALLQLSIFALGVLQSTTLITVARSGARFPSGAPECSQLITNDAWYAILLMVITMTAGTGLIMWMGELITERGIGNGMSLLIFTSIAATFPGSLWAIGISRGWDIFAVVLAIGLLIVVAVVFVEQSQRRIPVQYAKRMVGRRTYGGNNTYIPIKVNMAGVVPVIFASSLLYLPALIAQFNQPAMFTLIGM